MTLKEALEQGYKKGNQAFSFGYISRKIDPMQQTVKKAGGHRKGDLYVDLPSWMTTKYHIRQYLYK